MRVLLLLLLLFSTQDQRVGYYSPVTPTWSRTLIPSVKTENDKL